MKIEDQVPRNALVWMICSLFTLVVPHVGRIPLWVLAIYLGAAAWRIMVYRGRWSFPGRLIKLLLIVAGTAGVYVNFGTLVGLEPTVALLLIAFAFKLIELASRKDAYVLLFLAYFICLLEFLFSQELPVVLYSTLNLLLVTTALVALHQPGQHQFNHRTVRYAGGMLLQALPLMVVLFLLFPRIGPLWSVPMQSHAAKTGVSDFMRPGDISNLSQSADVAFRAEFIGEIPANSALYWRGLVFSVLEGETWRSMKLDNVHPFEFRPRFEGPATSTIDYSVIMEPTQQSWLYSLDYATSITREVITLPDFRLRAPAKLTDEFHYEVRSQRGLVLEPNLSSWRRKIETTLPGGSNPRTREMALAMRQQAQSDRDYMRAVLARYYREPYSYTLKPQRLVSADRVDQFLFDTLEGFCEHFASSFVVLMRAAGVPARVVAGYQGGERNPVNNTVIVHQFDAHAWAEVWFEGEGWVQVDPTAQVAPERIEYGLEAAMRREGSFLSDSPLSPLRYRNIEFINRLRLQYDAATYRWQKWVIGFDTDRQFELLGATLGDLNARKFSMVLLGSFALVLVPVAFLLLFRRRVHELSVLDKHYLEFCERVSRRGPQREPGETPLEFAARAGTELPALAGRLHIITTMYMRLAYGGGDYDAKRRAAMLDDFKRTVRRFGKREAKAIV